MVALTPKPVDGIVIGQVFLGKYQVESILGQGGMGIVVECTHLALNERVAIKMLRQDVLLDRDAVERFMREAKAAARLKSEYVAKVSDVGELENGTPYMVMEFLEGQDLGQLLAERHHVPVPWATELVLQTAEALAEAHALEIVHRDVKPSNLFVTWRPDGTALIKVLDFGISKSPMGTDMHLTQTQSLLGTPAYMSPEQMRSARHVDARTDIWSLGTVMYELIEGSKPFQAESFSEMCVKVAVDPPAPMTHAPPELQQVVMRCLAKNPDQRYASMAELASDLVPFTQDPQQSSILVERMQRLFRLSQGDGWEGHSTGAGAGRVPRQVRDVASAPVRIPSPVSIPWRAVTPVAGVPVRAATPVGGVPQTISHEPSFPVATVDEARPKRRRFVVVALAAAIVGVVAVAVGFTRGGDTERSEITVESKPDPAATAAAQAKAQAAAQAKADERERLAAEQAARDDEHARVAAEQAAAAAKLAEAKAASAAKADEEARARAAARKAKAAAAAARKKNPSVDKPPVVEVQPKVIKKKCDPFKSRTACPKS